MNGEKEARTGTVRTVTGDVDASQLGITSAHEHLLITAGAFVKLDKDFLLDDREVMAREIAAFTGMGGHTLVDMMPPGLGRDPEGLRELSERTGTLIVAATGFHKESYYDMAHWLYHYAAEQIAGLFRAEIEEGMDQWGYRGPLMRRTAARAGVIKIATDYYRWNKHTDRWFEATAMAHLATGVPIASHTENGVLGDRQAESLISLGVPPSSIVIGHIDKNADPYVHRELAAMGVFLQYDSPSRLKYGPDSDAVALIAAAAHHGYADQILLGLDFARRSYFPSYGGGPGLGYLLKTFVPRLKAEGLEEVVPLIFVDNPARALSFAGGAERDRQMMAASQERMPQ
ncbi:MAG: phosphotriesterase family protein [Chloroflexota bacterium]|nr:MAG: aryldialkylphosphatase [Chloroflexota bacterium]